MAVAEGGDEPAVAEVECVRRSVEGGSSIADCDDVGTADCEQARYRAGGEAGVEGAGLIDHDGFVHVPNSSRMNEAIWTDVGSERSYASGLRGLWFACYGTRA